MRLHLLKANQWISAFSDDSDPLPLRGRETDRTRIDETLPEIETA